LTPHYPLCLELLPGKKKHYHTIIVFTLKATDKPRDRYLIYTRTYLLIHTSPTHISQYQSTHIVLTFTKKIEVRSSWLIGLGL